MSVMITEGSGYKLANIVLSQREPFTIDDIMLELEKEGVKEDELFLKKSLNRLCENGIIIKFGSRYSLSISHF